MQLKAKNLIHYNMLRNYNNFNVIAKDLKQYI